jgi:hypothetical protein
MEGQQGGGSSNRRLRPARTYGEHSHSVVVMPLVSEFALWIVLIGLVVLVVVRARHASRCLRPYDQRLAVVPEELSSGKEVEDQDCPSQLLHLKVAIAGCLSWEADVRDAAELRMSLGWAKTVWPNALTSFEVSRNGKSIVFANQIDRDITNNYCPSGGISARIVERVELDTLGEVPEQPLLEMMVREWL